MTEAATKRAPAGRLPVGRPPASRPPVSSQDRTRRLGLELTPRGRITLLLAHLTGSAAWITGEPVTQLATAALAAPFLVDLVIKLVGKPKLEIAVSKRRTEAGLVFTEAVTLTNHSQSRHAHALEIEEPATSIWRDGGTLFVETLPADTTARLEIPARARRRGISSERSVQIATRHPFGMFLWRTDLECSARLVVEPMRVQVPGAILDEVRSSGDEPDFVGTSAGPEFFAMREYRVGDDARDVHARRSAQRGSLVTREMRGGADRRAFLVVDLRRASGHPAHGRLFGDHGVEQRLSLAASILDALRQHQVEPTCILIGGGTRIFEPAARLDFMDALATARSMPFEGIDDEAIAEHCSEDGKAYWVAAGGLDAAADVDRIGRAWRSVVRVERHEVSS